MSKIKITRQQESELPATIELQFINKNADFQQGSQAARRMAVRSIQKTSINAAIVFDDSTAKNVAEKLMYNVWVERDRFTLRLPRRYAYLEPTDVITLIDNDLHFKYAVRIVKRIEARNGEIEIEAVADQSPVYIQRMVTGNAVVTPQVPAIASNTIGFLMDLPILREQDAGAGFYVALAGSTSIWSGGAVYQSQDGGANYSVFQSSTTAASIGRTSSQFANWTNTGEIDPSFVDIVALSGQFATTTATGMANLANLIAVETTGGGWEIMQYQNAVLTGTTLEGDTYRLSGFYRGLFGTEWAISQHAGGNKIVVLDTTSVQRVKMYDGAIGIPLLYKMLTVGQALGSVNGVNYINQGIAYTPYAPINLAASLSGHDILLNWQRRPHVGEATGEIDTAVITIWTPDYVTAKRYFTRYNGNATPPVTYTEAMQIEDFGGRINDVYFTVFERSTKFRSLNGGSINIDGYVSRAHFTLDNGGSGTVVTPVPVITAFSVASKSAATTLSTDNLTATSTAEGGSGVRSNSTNTSGKVYFEINVNAMPSPSSAFSAGIGNATINLSNSIGSDNNGIGATGGNTVYTNGVRNNIGGPVPTAGSVMGFAVDLTAKRFWVRTDAGGWQGISGTAADPVSNSNGIPFSVVGPYYIAVDMYSLGVTLGLKTGGSFSGAIPSGFVAWDATATVQSTNTGGDSGSGGSPGTPISNPLPTNGNMASPVGKASLTSLSINDSDDGFVKIVVPFKVNMFGVNYGTDLSGGIYVGTNSYVTFGAGKSEYSPTASNIGKAIMIHADDRSAQRIYAGSEGDTYRVRFEGSDTTFGTAGSPSLSWEMTFYTSGQIMLVMGGDSAEGTGLSGITDGTTLSPTFAPASYKSYVLTPDSDGRNWSITEGSIGASTGPIVHNAIQQEAASAVDTLGLTATNVAATTWSAADKGSNITLSGGDLVATKASPDGYQSVRSTTAHNGKRYFEATFNTKLGQQIGLLNAASAFASYVGSGSDGMAYEVSTGRVLSNGSNRGTVATASPGSTIRFAFEVSGANRFVWISVDGGNWNNSATANPSTGVGGISVPLTGSLYQIAASLYYSTETVTLKQKSSYGYAVPTGFTAWDDA